VTTRHPISSSVDRVSWSGIGTGRAERIIFLAFVTFALGVLAIRYAEPILDGDLFWHLKYAAQMLARGSLVPDHSLYSWTPATTDTIYCAWLGELLLYGLYQAGGLPILFAFRYLCLAVAAVLLLRTAASRSVPSLRALAIVLASLLAARGGTIIKPEILSFLAFHCVVFTYCAARYADRNGLDSRRIFLVIPLIVVVWVNAHGGFMLAAPFFLATFIGEILMRWRRTDAALSTDGLTSMIVAWALSAVAVCITPYGWHYPAQLIADYLLHTGPRVGESWNVAYRSLLTLDGFSEFRDYGLVMAVVTAGLMVLARRHLTQTNWGLLLALILYVPLFLLYARAAFFLAVAFGYASLDLLAVLKLRANERRADKRGLPRGRLRLRFAYGCAALLIIVAGMIALYSARLAEKGSWVGFGVSYVNPVAEADFLAASQLGTRLYNIFDSGGYLLWRLDPSYKVMIDSRFFPYKAWFSELYGFSTGETFAEFLQKYPADTAIIDLDRIGVLKNFLQSSDWKLAFYGPTSAIFVRRTIGDEKYPATFTEDRFDRLRNAQTALNVFDFATVIGDYPTAWKVLGQIEMTLRPQIDRESLDRANALREGYRLLAIGNYDRALVVFRLAAKRPMQGWREPVIVRLLEDRTLAEARGNMADVVRHDAALRELSIAP
jgi:hypothetical protein